MNVQRLLVSVEHLQILHLYLQVLHWGAGHSGYILCWILTNSIGQITHTMKNLIITVIQSTEVVSDICT